MNVNGIIIEIEGHDKNGKDTIHKYIEQLSNYKYSINVRGILTQLVYNDKFNRDNTYRILYKPLIILLETDDQDVEIRCRMTKEPKINCSKDREVYREYAKELEDKGLAIIWRFNTSNTTPYILGKEIVSKLNTLDKLDNKEIEDMFLLDKVEYIETHNYYISEDLKDEDVYYGALSTTELSEINGRYLECRTIDDEIFYRDLETGKNLPIGSVPIIK